MRPFLKWAGGKYRVIDKIHAALPEGKRLIEPFVGAAAVFLNSDYPHYLLAEANRDLIGLYKILKKEKQRFIDYACEFFTPAYNQEKKYYQLRDLFNTTEDKRFKAALFLYLNRHGYNGLCRYNSDSKFNVPYGRYKKPYFPEKEMRYFCRKLSRVKFVCADFMATMKLAQRGDVVYCDPPYVPLSKTAMFTDYYSGGFSEVQQLALVMQAQRLANKGVTTVISNHDTEFVQRHYQAAEIHRFEVQRSISCQGSRRGKVAEVLAVFR
ncbi:MAG: Dam family site-specific DNA-(adenine-N6)-methyltransferase [Gammaproteobacteria bacterium]